MKGFSKKREMRGSTLKKLSEGLLRSAGQTGEQGALLEIHHPSAPRFEPLFLHTASEAFGLSISLPQGEDGIATPMMRCDSGQLPFQDRAFKVVVLHHVISDGREAELAEAARVLARDGVLILLGLNRMGWRFRTQEHEHRLPGMAPLKVKNRLESLRMTLQGFAGAGLGGMSRPAWMHSGFASLGAPLADVVLLRAKHSSSPEFTPLRFRKSHRAVVQSAPMRG